MRAIKGTCPKSLDAALAARNLISSAAFSTSASAAAQVADYEEAAPEAAPQVAPAMIVETVTRRNLSMISLPSYIATGVQTAIQASNPSRLMRRRSQQLTQHLRLRSRSKGRGGVLDMQTSDGASLLHNRRRKEQSWSNVLKSISKMDALPMSEDLEAMLEETHGADEVKRQAPNDPGKLEYDAAATAGYAAARLPACYAVALRIFDELELRMPDFRPTSLLDFGAGPGTAIWAATDIWEDSLQVLHAVEPSAAMTWLGTQVEQQRHAEMDQQAAEAASTDDHSHIAADEESLQNEARRQSSSMGASISGRRSPSASVRWLQRLRGFRDKQDRGKQGRKAPGRWIQSSRSSYDLVVASYSLGELEDARERRWALKALWEATTGMLVLVEPGTPVGSALVRAARAQILEWETDAKGNRSAHVVAPCPHDGRCPMDGKATWCHFGQRFERTELQRRVKLRKGRPPPRDHQDERFSYVVLRKGPRPQPGPDVAVARGVSRRLPPEVRRAMAAEAELQAEEEEDTLEQLLMSDSDEDEEVRRLILESMQGGGDDDEDVSALIEDEWEGLRGRSRAKGRSTGIGPAGHGHETAESQKDAEASWDLPAGKASNLGQPEAVHGGFGAGRPSVSAQAAREEAREGMDDEPGVDLAINGQHSTGVDSAADGDGEDLELEQDAQAFDPQMFEGTMAETLESEQDADSYDPQMLVATVAASQQWSRIIRPLRKHHRLIVVDTCAAAGPENDPAAEGHLLRQTVGASDRDSWLGSEGFRLVRRSRWGDLWPSHIQQQARVVEGKD